MIKRQIKNFQLTSHFSIFQIAVFAFIFFLLTILGTLSHEGSHYIVAKYLGLKPFFHYGSVTFAREVMLIKPDAATYHSYILCMIAGPLQTILTGLAGFVLLLARKVNKCVFSKTDFVGVFLSLFWLRECFNLLTIFIIYIFYGKSARIGGDESVISGYFGFNELFLNLILGFIGAVICYLTVFVLLPKKYRLNLIVAGFLGSLIGFIGWYYFLGKMILP